MRLEGFIKIHTCRFVINADGKGRVLGRGQGCCKFHSNQNDIQPKIHNIITESDQLVWGGRRLSWPLSQDNPLWVKRCVHGLFELLTIEFNLVEWLILAEQLQRNI